MLPGIKEQAIGVLIARGIVTTGNGAFCDQDICYSSWVIAISTGY
jgi:hypothetical protein